jgi:anaerobic ribonucleoside-triphosphate reductase
MTTKAVSYRQCNKCGEQWHGNAERCPSCGNASTPYVASFDTERIVRDDSPRLKPFDVPPQEKSDE